jgi:hypothetical protein
LAGNLVPKPANMKFRITPENAYMQDESERMPRVLIVEHWCLQQFEVCSEMVIEGSSHLYACSSPATEVF